MKAITAQSKVIPWSIAFAVVAVAATVTVDLVFPGIDFKFWADVALAAASVAVTGFSVRYAFWSKWWTNRIGQVYLVKCVAISLFLCQASIAVWWDDDYPYRQQIRFLIYALCALAYIPMMISLVREQRRDRDGSHVPPHKRLG